MAEAKGVWIDGKISKKELKGLKSLIKMATIKLSKGELPWKFQNEKITFEAINKRNTLLISYGWNFPPAIFWFKGVKDPSECQNCYPQGKEKDPAREVWCEKLGYHFPKCPYGAPTPEGVVS